MIPTPEFRELRARYPALAAVVGRTVEVLGGLREVATLERLIPNAMALCVRTGRIVQLLGDNPHDVSVVVDGRVMIEHVDMIPWERGDLRFCARDAEVRLIDELTERIEHG